MGGCFGSHSQVKQPVQEQKVSRTEEVDRVKSGLKVTRDKIDNLINQHERQLTAVERQIQVQKDNGLKNKPKAIYLLRQKKDFQEQIQNMNIRRQAILKTLGTVAQQQLDQQMVTVLQQSNQYMKKVQDQLERKNWRQIIAQAQTNKYNPIEFREAEGDPQVDALYAELQKQVFKQPPTRVKEVEEIRNTDTQEYQLTKQSKNLQYN